MSVFRQIILQTAVNDDMRGRIQGVLIAVSVGGPLLAGPLHGIVADVAGTAWAISGGGALVVLGMLALVVVRPVFWRYRPPD